MDRQKVFLRSLALGKANVQAKKRLIPTAQLTGKETGLGVRNLAYKRTANSPYPKGSDEDRKLSADAQAYSAKNRANLAQGTKDVVSGRALAEGVRVVGRGALSVARKGFEAIDKRVTPASYKRDKDNSNRMMRPDVQQETKRQIEKKEKLRKKLRE